MKPLISLNALVPEYFNSTSVSLVLLKSYVRNKWKPVEGRENPVIKINNFFCEDDPREIIQTICSVETAIIGFAVYPWNYRLMKGIVSETRRRQPQSLIVLGGPSVSFDAKNGMRNWPGADIIVKGPGEETFFQLLMTHMNQKPFTQVPNIVYRQDPEILENPFEMNFSVEKQSYPLITEDLEGLEIVNYDTARGCGFRCNYCAWNVDGTEPWGVRYYPMGKVKADLERIFKLDSLVKLLINDSNITVNESRCIDIFRFINRLNKKRQERGKPFVMVVLDLNPQYFSDRIISELKKMHIGVLGFGLQSIDEDVLRIANRKFNREKYLSNLKKLSEKRGIQIIIELIFGLPGDTLDKFRKNMEFYLSELRTYSFICFRFLVLPGSPFWYQREKYGIVHQADPPFDVVSTHTFSEAELNYADRLASWFELFFSIFRTIKKTIESHAINTGQPQVPIYEKLFERLFPKYEYFFDRGWKQEHTYFYIGKLRQKRYAHIRKKILSDSRKILRDIL
jgi:radical SAM superfamily enzyme YgiQ (UPF0313 family)